MNGFLRRMALMGMMSMPSMNCTATPPSTDLELKVQSVDYGALEEQSTNTLELGDVEIVETYQFSHVPLATRLAQENIRVKKGKSVSFHHEKKRLDWVLYIEKDQRRLSAYVVDGFVSRPSRNVPERPGAILLKQYPIQLGWNPIGAKRVEGDGKSPEGIYRVSFQHPKSKFGLALYVSYPNTDDANRAEYCLRQNGWKEELCGLGNRDVTKESLARLRRNDQRCQVPFKDSGLGNYIEIHGSNRDYDWTAGCIAMREISEIFSLSSGGCSSARVDGKRVLRSNTYVIIVP